MKTAQTAWKITLGSITTLFLGLFVVSAWACASYGRSDAGRPDTLRAPADPVPADRTGLSARQREAQAAYDEAPKIVNESPTPEGWPALTPANEIRVKQYPAYRAAVITADASGGASGGGSGNGLFRPLFNHIKRRDIAMTAPVEMTYGDNGMQDAMAFLYRTADMGDAGADPDDPRIEIRDIPEQTALSIGVFGSYSHKRFEQAVQQLNTWMGENAEAWRTAGEPRYLGYNSPFVPPFMRYGEVQVPIEPVR